MCLEANTSSSHQAPISWWALFLCAAVSFVGILDHDLWTPDEPRVAAISLEMSRNGNVIVPHLAGKPFVEKPSLYFAVAAGFIKATGSFLGNAGAVRLTSALWGIGTLIMTYLIGRILIGRNGAFFSTGLLATMSAFVDSSHWIIVDIALLFFVTAAVWSSCEAYLCGKRHYLPLTGVFTAGAFLSKGIIGLAFVGLVWLALFVPWVIGQKQKPEKGRFWIPVHVISLLAFVLIAGSWMVALRVTGGKDLWDAWFLDNHFGRFTGSAKALGHIHKGKPLFYVMAALSDCLPWTPLVLIWLFSVARDSWKKRRISKETLVLLAWGAGSVLFLSLPATKRDIYLLPALPAFAVSAGMIIVKGGFRWVRYYFWLWISLCIISIAVLAGSGLLVPFIPERFLEEQRVARTLGFLGQFTMRHFAATVCLVLCVYAISLRKKIGFYTLSIMVTALTCIAWFSVGAKAIDLNKSKRDEFASFVGHIPRERLSSVVGYKLGESERAYFYFYLDWILPQDSNPRRMVNVLADTDHEFDSIITTTEYTGDFREGSFRVMNVTFTNENEKKQLCWVDGKNDKT